VQASEAGRVLGEFHRALDDFDHEFAATRAGVHDLGRHIDTLNRTLEKHSDHPGLSDIRAIADGILAIASRLEPLPATPQRIVHGDPKISNVIFAGDRAVCLIDLDTVAPMALPLELGDALRSWCDPAGEDSPASHFSAERFRASLEGYRSGVGTMLSASEWQALPLAALTISVELAARFAADALAEAYFAWDPANFESRSHHNRIRAAGQLALAREIEAELPKLQRIVMTLM
jgi:Ser/Thr protein kinase RdoA (MazF antagonist)